MCDPAEMVAGLKSDFQQIKQQREKIFDGANAFFDRLFTDNFYSDDVVHQRIDLSSDEESEDEPVKYRIMTMRTCSVFDRKPKKKKPKKIQDDEAVNIPPPVVIKPVCIDRGSQAKKAALKSLETQTSLKAAYSDSGTTATTTAQVQTHSLRHRHEATNTDNVLPSYENVCIAFLESLLEDAPVFMNSGPKPEQLEGILMDFLDQLLNDARNYHDPNDSHSDSSSPQPINTNRKKAKLVDANIQQEVPLQTAATQAPISLKSLEAPCVLVNYSPQPKLSYFVGEIMKPNVTFDKKPDGRFRLMHISKCDNFAFPPSLRTEVEKPPITLKTEGTSPVTTVTKEKQTETEQQNKMLQIDIMNSMDVTVKPDHAAVANQNVIHPSPLFQTGQPQAQQPPPSKHKIQQSPPPSQPTQQPPPLQVPPQYDIPKLNPLNIESLEEIQELSNFNLETFIKDLDSSDDDDDDTDIGSSYDRSSGELSNSTINSSFISDALQISSLGSASDMSSGEVRTSFMGSDSCLSGISNSSESSAPYKWYK